MRMSETTRRNVINAGATGAAAVVGAAGMTQAAQAAQGPRAHNPRRAQEPVVAHIANPASDTITLMLGEREVEVRDRDLVLRLLDAAGGI
jgi:hypothetical protein